MRAAVGDPSGIAGRCRAAVAMLIPAAVIELDEAHIAFGEPAREQAVGRIGAQLRDSDRISENGVRFLREVGDPAPTSACDRPSRCAIRVSISGSPLRVALHRVQLRGRIEHLPPSRDTPGGSSRRHCDPPPRNLTPDNWTAGTSPTARKRLIGRWHVPATTTPQTPAGSD